MSYPTFELLRSQTIDALKIRVEEYRHKVTGALAKGWSLHGHPSYAFDAKAGVMRCAQAVVKDVDGPYDPAMKLGDR